MTNVPPLDPEIVSEVQQLWPRIEWTTAMRQEWRKRLGLYPTDRVLAALRDTYATDTGYPSLPKILNRLKATAPSGPAPWRQTMQNEQLKDQIDREAEQAKERLRGLPTAEKKHLVEQYRERIGRTPPTDLDTWTNTQVLLATAILELHPAEGVVCKDGTPK
tara:strand:+ start:664 stop:1149 length:486 start_codon:yes stop_codon:yes gene_type:complete